MYRVELKEPQAEGRNLRMSKVPNVPCGVERGLGRLVSASRVAVPNVPCGVERKDDITQQLKDRAVPNVPCGVESFPRVRNTSFHLTTFLMYRVELKGSNRLP